MPENKVEQKSENLKFCIFVNGNILHNKTCLFLAPVKKKIKQSNKVHSKEEFCLQAKDLSYQFYTVHVFHLCKMLSIVI